MKIQLWKKAIIQKTTLSDKFSKETVQDFQNWEEYGYDDIPDYKTEYENYLPSDKMPDRQIAETRRFPGRTKKAIPVLQTLDENKYNRSLILSLIHLMNSDFSHRTWKPSPKKFLLNKICGFRPSELEPVLKGISRNWIPSAAAHGISGRIFPDPVAKHHQPPNRVSALRTDQLEDIFQTFTHAILKKSAGK